MKRELTIAKTCLGILLFVFAVITAMTTPGDMA
jgi:hypothetical protein